MSKREVFERMIDVISKQLDKLLQDREVFVTIGISLKNPSPVDFLVNQGYGKEDAEEAVSKVKPGDSERLQDKISRLNEEIAFHELMLSEFRAKLNSLPNLLITEGPPNFSRDQMSRMLDSLKRADVPGIVGLQHGPFSEEEAKDIIRITDGENFRLPVSKNSPMNRHERRAARARARQKRK